MTITINNIEYKLKYTIRAIFIFEQIAKKPFEVTTTLDNYLFFYCMILANNPDTALDWDDFLDAVDNDKSLLLQLNKVIMDYQQKNELFNDGGDSGEKKS